MEFYSNFIWEKNGRENNEDSLCFKQVTKDKTTYLLAVVCDGIGGLKEGENASTYVADSMGKELLQLLERKKMPSPSGMRRAFLRKIHACHRFLQIYGEEKKIRLGTTLSMVVLCGNKGYLFHVGDSAVFMGKRKMKRKTTPHRTTDGALKMAIGVGQAPGVEWTRISVKKGSRILLASDGFYRRTEDLIYDKTLFSKGVSMDGEKEIAGRLRMVYETAVQRGEKDNVTAIEIVCR